MTGISKVKIATVNPEKNTMCSSPVTVLLRSDDAKLAKKGGWESNALRTISTSKTTDERARRKSGIA